MGEVIVSSVIKDVVEKFNSLAIQELDLIRGFSSDFLDLADTFAYIRAVAEDAEVKQRKYRAAHDWLRNLRAVSLEMESILDEVLTEALIRRVEVQRGIKYQVSAFFSARNPVLLRNRMGHRLKDVRRRLETIAAARCQLALQASGHKDMEVTGDLGIRFPDSVLKSMEKVVRYEDKEMIIGKIFDVNLANHGDGISVCAIVGMGGIGKTTLAGLVYNDEGVTQHFDLKMWISVSYDFDVPRLTKIILQSIEGISSTLSELGSLQERLKEKLQGKRFLLVLDDVWNEDHMKWERLRETLNCGASGSVVMVTTRMESIARMMTNSLEFIHSVGLLTFDESWSLFESLAFGVGRTEENISELTPIAREIVMKCHGIPLAVKALGSMMWSKSSIEEWMLLHESDVWEQDEWATFPALKLSYDDLSHASKQCFAYCSIFPKDHVMDKDLLIKLWMANRFITSRGEEDLYHLGEEIFQGLVWRSFLHEVVEDEMGRTTCKMHDSAHDLAQFVMGDECIVIQPGMKSKLPAEVLHLSSLEHLQGAQDLAKVRTLRSIFIFDASYWDTIPYHITNQSYLTVLNLTRIRSKTLPESICNLKHLRYFDVSFSALEALPESIIYLQNLLVLNLHSCGNLLSLPVGMKFMSNLQSLDILKCDKLEKMPAGMGQLAGLRKLGKFIVGQTEGNKIGELARLNLLGPELEIEGLDNIRSLEDATGAKLKEKENLISLKLVWSIGKVEEEVLEGLEPHSNMKSLAIHNYGGSRSPKWMVNLVNLIEVRFEGCYKWESLPPLGAFPFLKILKLLNNTDLKSFHVADCTDNTRFPSLKILDIHDCNRLIGMPCSLPKLESLDINGCLDLVSFPDGMGILESLSYLSVRRCPNLNFDHLAELLNWEALLYLDAENLII